jgi:hypothetical protein
MRVTSVVGATGTGGRDDLLGPSVGELRLTRRSRSVVTVAARRRRVGDDPDRREQTMDRVEAGEDCHDGGMPLVLCRSRGGPYDDAFSSGWRLGGIGALLAGPGISALCESIRAHERVQADLLAMACGYSMTVDPSTDPDWLSVTFTRIRGDG